MYRLLKQIKHDLRLHISILILTILASPNYWNKQWSTTFPIGICKYGIVYGIRSNLIRGGHRQIILPQLATDLVARVLPYDQLLL